MGLVPTLSSKDSARGRYSVEGKKIKFVKVKLASLALVSNHDNFFSCAE